jgi:protein involved in polysaccharide export with SLBB domain
MPSANRIAAETPRPAPVPRELEKTVVPAHIVQPGDGLLIEPLDLDSPIRIPADQPVMADGTIDLGKYGRLTVAGLRVEEIEAMVNAAVRAEERDASEFDVRLINPQSAVYYVLGDVNSPGVYPLIGRETALDAIMAAGGLSDRGSRCDIVLSRPSLPDDCRTILPICYDHIVQLGDTSTNYQIAPGDRIFVASRSCWQDLLPDCIKHGCPLCQTCCTQACGGAVVPQAPPVTYAVPGTRLESAPASPGASGGVEMVPPAPADEALWTPVTERSGPKL